jgi:hypothetical protein
MSNQRMHDTLLVNSALGRANRADESSDIARLTRDIAKGEAASAKRQAEELAAENRRLSTENTKLRAKLATPEDARLAEEHAELEETRRKLVESEAMRMKQKELLREWMASQTAFKSLFKKYGKMPNGTPVADLSKEERIRLVDEELAVVGKTMTP